MCIGDREMVMTLNMPAMKAYLARKNHRSLATLPGVALALNDQNRPVALGYCNMPKLFDLLYPLLSLCATAMAGAAQQGEDRSGSDLLAVGPGDPASLAARHHHRRADAARLAAHLPLQPADGRGEWAAVPGPDEHAGGRCEIRIAACSEH